MLSINDKLIINDTGDVTIKGVFDDGAVETGTLKAFRKKSPILKECEGANSTNE